MKKYVLFIASALLLAGCSAPAAAPADQSAEAAATPSAPASPAPTESAPASAPGAAARMSSEATCAELDTLFDPSLLPGGGTDAEIDGLIGTVGTLPDRASENLKDAIPAVVEIAKIMLTDAKNDTRELDKHMEEPGVSDRYLNAAESISTVCYPVESIQPGESTDTGEIAEGEEPFEGEVVEAEEIPAG